MRTTTEGLVLKTTEYGEADLIVTYATPDLGVVQGFAKSPRKIRSRFGASLEPLTHARIGLLGREGAALPRLVQSDIVHPFSRLRDTLEGLLRAAEIARLFQRFTARGEARPRKFGLLLATLHSMESTGRHELLAVVFTVKLLWMSGYGPRLDTCGRCHGGIGVSAERYFHPSAGTVICGACEDGLTFGMPVSPGLAALFRDSRGLRLSEILMREGQEFLIPEARQLLEIHCAELDCAPG